MNTLFSETHDWADAGIQHLKSASGRLNLAELYLTSARMAATAQLVRKLREELNAVTALAAGEIVDENAPVLYTQTNGTATPPTDTERKPS